MATDGLAQLQQGRGIERTSSTDLARHIESLGTTWPKQKGLFG